jgi:heat shock protein HslJ
MKTLCTLVSLVIFSTLAAACSNASSNPLSPSSASASGSGSGGDGTAATIDLTGVWTLSSVQPAGQRAQPTPPGARYTLTFTDGRLTARVDCNTCSGAYTLSGQTLTTGPRLACTRAACQTMEFGDAYTGVLAGESTVRLSGGALELSSARGVLRFAR